MLLRHSQSADVFDLVQGGMPLSKAVQEVLGAIRDGSGPKTSEVVDEVMAMLADPAHLHEAPNEDPPPSSP